MSARLDAELRKRGMTRAQLAHVAGRTPAWLTKKADNLVQVGRYRWDLWEGPEGLSFVVIPPVVELEGSDAA